MSKRRIVPDTAWVTTNRGCNMRCLWCYARKEDFDPKQTLSLDLALRELEIIKTMGTKHIIIIGGEPTIWEPLTEFNRHCREAGIRTTLVTNAMRFADDGFWARYQACPNDRLSPSIKAFDDESAKKLTGAANIETVRRGLSRIIEKYDCGVSFVFSSYVRNNLGQLTQFAKSCGAKRISFSPCTPSLSCDGADTDGVVPFPEMVEAITAQYPVMHKLMDGKLAFAIKTPLCIWPQDFIATLRERKQLSTGCQFQGRSGIIFGPQGELLACNSLSQFPMGALDQDYSDAESLIDLLNSEAVTRHYGYVNSYPSPKCIDCPQTNICRGGCPLMWAAFDAKSTIPGLTG